MLASIEQRGAETILHKAVHDDEEIVDMGRRPYKLTLLFPCMVVMWFLITGGLLNLLEDGGPKSLIEDPNWEYDYYEYEPPGHDRRLNTGAGGGGPPALADDDATGTGGGPSPAPLPADDHKGSGSDWDWDDEEEVLFNCGPLKDQECGGETVKRRGKVGDGNEETTMMLQILARAIN